MTRQRQCVVMIIVTFHIRNLQIDFEDGCFDGHKFSRLLHYPPAHSLYHPAPDLALQPLLLRTARGFSCATDSRQNRNALHQFFQAPQGLAAILVLAAEFLRFDNHHAFFGNALIVQLGEPFLEFFWQRRRSNIETQMDCAGNLVYVLPARSLGTYGADLDLAVGDDHVVGDVQHLHYSNTDIAQRHHRPRTNFASFAQLDMSIY